MGEIIWGRNIRDGGHNFIAELYGNIVLYKRAMVCEVGERGIS